MLVLLCFDIYFVQLFFIFLTYSPSINRCFEVLLPCIRICFLNDGYRRFSIFVYRVCLHNLAWPPGAPESSWSLTIPDDVNSSNGLYKLDNNFLGYIWICRTSKWIFYSKWLKSWFKNLRDPIWPFWVKFLALIKTHNFRNELPRTAQMAYRS